MVRRGMMLGDVVSKAVRATLSVDNEVVLMYTVTYAAIKTHVIGFGAALLDGDVIDNASGTPCIVCLDGRWRLRMT